MTESNEKTPEATFEQLVAQLTLDQMRFVTARQECSTDKEAAESIGISPDTVKTWKQKGYPIDDVARLMVYDGIVIAKVMRRRNLAKAMAIKCAGLNSDDERIRQSVSTEIIEGELGKPKQTVDQNTSGEVVVRLVGNVGPDDV